MKLEMLEMIMPDLEECMAVGENVVEVVSDAKAYDDSADKGNQQKSDEVSIFECF